MHNSNKEWFGACAVREQMYQYFKSPLNHM